LYFPFITPANNHFAETTILIGRIKNATTAQRKIPYDHLYNQSSCAELETDRYIGPPIYWPIFDLLNISWYTNFQRYVGVLVYSTVCTNFIL